MAGKKHHSADEFGRTNGSGSVAGLDGPTLGAAGMIITDGIAERESGKTPSPPVVPVRAVVVGLVVMVLVGISILTFLIASGRQITTPDPSSSPYYD